MVSEKTRKVVNLALEFGVRAGQFFEVSVVKIAFSLLGFLFVSCSQLTSVQPKEDYQEPTWRISEEVYQKLEKGKGVIEISILEQKLRLRNEKGETAIETDCSTGVPGKETPIGSFRIKEMIVDKRSNKYGKYVSEKTGEVVVEKSWEVEKRPPGTRYLGIEMPYWMRLTWDGVGIHVGKFPRGYRSSFGCIRMPEEIQPYLYQKSRSGMKVQIMGEFLQSQ